MELTKPLLIKRTDTNKIKTSSGEFLEYISWKKCKDLAIGVGVHNSRFPHEGYLVSKKVNEIVMLLNLKLLLLFLRMFLSISILILPWRFYHLLVLLGFLNNNLV